MYLGIGLLNLERPVTTSKKDRGPDFNLHYHSEQSVWIEAVAPLPDDAHTLPELLFGVFDLPEEAFLLRLTSALDTKRRKFATYQDGGIVGEKDCCIIALSASALNQFGSLMDFPAPAPLKVLAGAGVFVLADDGSYTTVRGNLHKSSGREVDVRLFENTDFQIISALLYSATDPLNSPDKAESTFKVFHNPLAHNPLPKEMFVNAEQWFRIKHDANQTLWQRYNRSLPTSI